MIDDYVNRLKSFLPSDQDLSDYGGNPVTEELLNSLGRIITWFNLLYRLRSQDDTAVLISAAHSKIIEIWILVPLGLLHSSYSALRTVIDISTSYTFYSSHPIEWQAVSQDRSGWESRSNIVNWHIKYTPTCREINGAFGLADALDKDYQKLSSYVHGIPMVGLPTLKGIERNSITDTDMKKLKEIAQDVDSNLNLLFLSVFHQDLVTASRKDLQTVTRGIDRHKLAAAGVILPRV